MDNFWTTIGLLVLLLFIMFACDPEGLGRNAGKIVSGYNSALTPEAKP